MDNCSCVFYIMSMLSDIAEYKLSMMSDETIAKIADVFMRQESFKPFLRLYMDYYPIKPHFKNSTDYIEYHINK